VRQHHSLEEVLEPVEVAQVRLGPVALVLVPEPAGLP
jgi:hypothetical protein